MSKTLDTNVVLYHLAGQLAEELPQNNLSVSIVTQIELLSFKGLNEESEKQIQEFLTLVDVIPVDEPIGSEAIRIRLRTSLKTPDAIIAATSMVLGTELLTHDLNLLKVPGLTTSAPILK